MLIAKLYDCMLGVRSWTRESVGSSVLLENKMVFSHKVDTNLKFMSGNILLRCIYIAHFAIAAKRIYQFTSDKILIYRKLKETNICI